MTRLFGAVGAVGLTVGAAWGGPPAPAPTPAELVAKLGSEEYAEREAAARALQQIGPDALPVLRDALKSSDPEVRARVAPVVTRLQRTADSVGRLTPRKVALNYKDTPLGTALSDFKTRSGLPVSLDPARIADPLRKVTCVTADLPVWEALDEFCTAAGLKEEFRSELDVAKAQPMNRRAYVPPPQAPHPDAVPIVLADGKGKSPSGDRRTAVRVVVLPSNFPGHRVTLGTGDTTLCFDVAPAPGLNWVDVTAVRVTRLIDDSGRAGGAGRARSTDGGDAGDDGVVVFGGVGGFGGGGFIGRGGMRFDPRTGMPIYPDTLPNPRIIEVPFKLGTPTARSIKRLEGAVLGEVLLTNQTLLTLADPTKATGTAHDGLGQLRLTVQGVIETKTGGTQVQVLLQYPTPWSSGARRGFNPGGIWPEAPRQGGTPSVQAFDAAGKAMGASTSTGYTDSSDDGQTMHQHVTLTFRKDAGTPAKFVVTGPRPMVVAVPFAMENVPLP